jgi:hypothetical protein
VGGVISVRPVGEELWLGIAGPVSRAAVPPALRFSTDRAAADLAEMAAVAAAARPRAGCAISRSHTRGCGAALVGPAPARVGVDIVALDRVERRHAEEVVDGRGWAALASEGPIRAGLAWALKEAAAKATGEPARCFPSGLRIVASASGVRVHRTDGPGQVFVTGWLEWSGYLCAWAREVEPHSA